MREAQKGTKISLSVDSPLKVSTILSCTFLLQSSFQKGKGGPVTDLSVPCDHKAPLPVDLTRRLALHWPTLKPRPFLRRLFLQENTFKTLAIASFQSAQNPLLPLSTLFSNCHLIAIKPVLAALGESPKKNEKVTSFVPQPYRGQGLLIGPARWTPHGHLQR